MFEQLSAFVARASYEDMSSEARRQIKMRLLDWLGCAIGAVESEPMGRLRDQIEKAGGRPLATMIGGGKTSPDRAAVYNGALARHLGFNDSFISVKGSCRPGDSLPAVLAVSEYQGASGREFLTALGVAYQVHCRLCEVTENLGHSAVAACAGAAGVAKALKLNQYQIANVIAATAPANGLSRAARGVGPSGCKTMLHPDSPFSMDQALLLAMSSVNDNGKASGINKRFSEAGISNLEIDWDKENLESVRRTAIKKYNAEIYSQSALEAILYLRERQPCHPDQIERIELDTFDVAYNVLDGNAQGAGYEVRSRAEAYRSLPYLLAVALLDGEVSPRQYEPGRILREDVQSLMRRVMIRTDADFSRRFPEQMPARAQIILRAGQVLTKEKHDYEGHVTRPMSWESLVEKFKNLTMFHAGYETGQRIIQAVLDIEEIGVRELTKAVAGIVKATKDEAHEKVFRFRKHRPAA